MKFYSNLLTATALLMGTALLSCGSSNRNDNRTKEESTEEISNIQVPEFNADSAYAYVAAQTAFGPRVPNSNAQNIWPNSLKSSEPKSTTSTPI